MLQVWLILPSCLANSRSPTLAPSAPSGRKTRSRGEFLRFRPCGHPPPARRNRNHFFGLLCLDPWLEGLQPGEGELDRLLVTAGRVVCELSHGGSEVRNLLALPLLVDGHGLAHRLHKDGG